VFERVHHQFSLLIIVINLLEAPQDPLHQQSPVTSWVLAPITSWVMAFQVTF
jgi:hypothetical protein